MQNIILQCIYMFKNIYFNVKWLLILEPLFLISIFLILLFLSFILLFFIYCRLLSIEFETKRMEVLFINLIKNFVFQSNNRKNITLVLLPNILYFIERLYTTESRRPNLATDRHSWCPSKHNSWWMVFNVFFHILYKIINHFSSLFR